ncbi:MAG: hypothetical protein EHM19_01325 [Candidatus Latescibacterota bacterium]|nr:MAG: hypothetical protein EHM19_01325 [Candidatus Latescibacterota bacterium]
MKRVLLLAPPAFVLALFAGNAALGARGDEIRAAHAKHREAGVECAVCHAPAETSLAGRDDLLPTKPTCAGCHDVEDAGACAQCHTMPGAPAAMERVTDVAGLFPHKTHLARGMECADCHGDPAAEPALPKKALCRTCHVTAAGYEDCRVCHADDEPLLPTTHASSWILFHGLDARAGEASCAGCHTEGGCQECHAGDNVRPRSHGLDYAFTHALEARGNEMACATCHEEPSFCVSCHVTEGVLPENHSRADWVLLDGGRHAEEARFDMDGCVACHGETGGSPVCADCHGR